MQTVILAGGLGTRLKEETVLKPKPMIEVGGKPILWHIMKIYHSAGHKDFLVLLGYKGEMIKEYFLNYAEHNSDIQVSTSTNKVTVLNDNACEDWTIKLVDTGLASMTGGRLKRAEKFLDDEFFFTYGDGVSDLDVNKLLAFHHSHGKIGTITAVNPPSRFGSLRFEGQRVASFTEKPVEGEGKINGGYFVFKKRIVDYIPGDDSVLERAPLEKLASEGQLMAFVHPGYWKCMDTVRDLDSLNADYAGGSAPWVKW